ncbi:MAG: HDOD domain-containing protein [Pseudomonadales bacterium]|nr:HDOD domain-containing protein [Pseudomonadales bacterium]MCP5182795.1 HDOD domain-containing protein [Pseudomonadales bacterium]
MTDLAQAIETELQEAAESDELELPTLPEVALRIRDVASDRNVSGTSLAAVVAEDPVLTAQLMRVANSPMFRAVKPIDDLQMAISRIGVEYAANLATGLAMQHMFQATSELIDRKLRETWSHAVDIAAICGVLARSFTDLASDQATLAGLTHSIGVLPILSWAEHNDHLVEDEAILNRVIESSHGSIGTMILTRWNFPPELASIPSQLTRWDREVADSDFTDLVQIATLQSVVGTEHPLTQLDWSEVSAFSRLGLDPDSARETLDSFRDAFDMAREIYH